MTQQTPAGGGGPAPAPRRWPVCALLLVAGSLVLALAAPVPADAESKDHDTPQRGNRDPKVGICHATGSASNPFVFVEVAEQAVEPHRAHGDVIGVANEAACLAALPLPASMTPTATRTPTPTLTPTNTPTNTPTATATATTVPCNVQTVNGGDGVTITTHNLGTAGTFRFDYNTFITSDRVTVYGGAGTSGPVLLDTVVPVPTFGTRTVLLNSMGFTEVTVRVEGRLGTAWTYTVHCPVP